MYRLAKESERMLKATLEIDTSIMEEILEYAHNTETPILSYNNEVELSSIVNLVYLCVRDSYRVEKMCIRDSPWNMDQWKWYEPEQ